MDSLFPDMHITERDPSTIVFKLEVGGEPMTVNECFWDELVVQGKPQVLQMAVKPTAEETTAGPSAVMDCPSHPAGRVLSTSIDP